MRGTTLIHIDLICTSMTRNVGDGIFLFFLEGDNLSFCFHLPPSNESLATKLI